jgi:predicted MPP superfamily phosphohydrolase
MSVELMAKDHHHLSAEMLTRSDLRAHYLAHREDFFEQGGRVSVLGTGVPESESVLKLRRWLAVSRRLGRFVPEFATNALPYLESLQRLDLREVTLIYANLPKALEGFRIIVIADPHFDGTERDLRRVLSVTDRISTPPDFMVYAGDYTRKHYDRHVTPRVIAQMGELYRSVKPRLGAAAIFGNHDNADMVKLFEEQHICFLINESVSIPYRDAELIVTGTEDPYKHYNDAARDILRRPKESNRPNFKLALVHSPELAQAAAEGRHDLYICGHTHGGQICWWPGRPINVLVNQNKHLANGRWHVEDMQGYTSSGIGGGFRLNCPAEVTLLTLRGGAPAP